MEENFQNKYLQQIKLYRISQHFEWKKNVRLMKKYISCWKKVSIPWVVSHRIFYDCLINIVYE